MDGDPWAARGINANVSGQRSGSGGFFDAVLGPATTSQAVGSQRTRPSERRRRRQQRRSRSGSLSSNLAATVAWRHAQQQHQQEDRQGKVGERIHDYVVDPERALPPEHLRGVPSRASSRLSQSLQKLPRPTTTDLLLPTLDDWSPSRSGGPDVSLGGALSPFEETRESLMSAASTEALRAQIVSRGSVLSRLSAGGSDDGGSGGGGATGRARRSIEAEILRASSPGPRDQRGAAAGGSRAEDARAAAAQAAAKANLSVRALLHEAGLRPRATELIRVLGQVRLRYDDRCCCR